MVGDSVPRDLGVAALTHSTNPLRLPPRTPMQSLGSEASYALNRRSENVVVKAVIIAELELRDIEVKVLFADVVEGSDNAALDDAPEPLNRIGVNRADDVLTRGVVDSGVGIALLTQMAIANPLIRAEQADLVRYGFVDEGFQGGSSDIGDNAGDDIALAADSASNDCLSAARCGAGQAIPFVGMAVLSLAADERLIDLDNATQLGFGFDQCGTDFVAHEPSGFDRTETHVAAKLASAHTLFAGQDQMRDLEPVAKRFVGVLENGPGDAREAIAVRRAFAALPVEALIGRCIVKVRIAAARAFDAIRPAPGDQIGFAGFIVANREHGIELG